MYKQKLIDLLKSDEQTKEAMEKLEFGCVMKTKTWIIRKFIEFERYNFKFYINKFYWIDKDWEIKLVNKSQYTIIWLPLSERFIRMYCLSKWYNCNFQNNNLIVIEKVWIDDIDIENNKQLLYKLISYELLKDFDNQDDLVYQKIYETLLELNK